MKQSENYKNVIAFQIFYMILLVGIIAVIISKKISQPIKAIINVIDEINKNSGNNKKNEFDYILNAINKSNDYIKDLEKDLYVRLVAFKKEHMRAMQSQINPHFIHNTLENINWKAIDLCDGDNDVSRMIRKLSELLRISFKSSDTIVTIKEETEHVRVYLEILEFRYEDKFDVTYKIDDNIMDSGIIKLTLQPLVENAIYHGLKEKEQKGMLIISGYKENDKIIFEIFDNGKGIEKEKLDLINEKLKEGKLQDDEDFSHIGLYNVNERIKMYFGEEFGVVIESVLNTYTKTVVTLPVFNIEDNSEDFIEGR